MSAPSLSDVLSRARAVLFDFDGPICSVFADVRAPTIASELRHLLQRDGHALDFGLVDEDDPLDVLRYSQRFGSDVVRQIEDALTEAEVRAVQVAEPTSGGARSLRSCVHSGRRAAIVTNNSPQAVFAYLSRCGLAEFAHRVVGRAYAEPHRMKPNADAVLRALDVLSIEAAEAVLVGDSASDMDAARAAGTWSIGYANRPQKRHHLADADAVIDDMGLLAAGLETDSIHSVGLGTE